MNQIEWHPAFDPEKVPDASYCTLSADIPNSPGCSIPTDTYVDSQNENNVNCDDPAAATEPSISFNTPTTTLLVGRYLMWYLGLDDTDTDDARDLDEIDTASSRTFRVAPRPGRSGALPRSTGAPASRRASRFCWTCLCVAEPKNVRFGSGCIPRSRRGGAAASTQRRIRLRKTSAVPIPNHAAQLEAAIKNAIIANDSGRRYRWHAARGDAVPDLHLLDAA